MPLPIPNPIPNSGWVSYSYVVDPSIPSGGVGSTESNIVSTQINVASIDNADGGLVKTAAPAFADVGDILTYTILLNNTGNVTAINVTFKDTIPNGTTFVTGSLTVNGSPDGSNPQSGISLGNLDPNVVTTIIFSVRVNATLPSPNPVPNNGTTTFSYTVDPSVPNGYNGSGNTNTVSSQINTATIDFSNGAGFVKSTDKTAAAVGDTITYTIILRNTGNVTANNVFFKDTIPDSTTYVTGSLIINGTPDPGNPGTPINIGNIAPGAASTIIFSVDVQSLPSPNPITNNATATFNYTVDPSIPDGGSRGGNSNSVTTNILGPVLIGSTKRVDKNYATLGDTLTYTITIPNTGNTTANNVVLQDTIPNGTAFMSGSVRVNGTTIVANPQTGIPVGSIGVNSIATIQFKVVVGATIPTPNPVPNTGTVNYAYTVIPGNPNAYVNAVSTNTVYTQINSGGFPANRGSFNKTVSPSYSTIGDTLTYTVVMINSGNTTVNNTYFIDTIPNGTTFVNDSLYVNGLQQIGASPAPPTGFFLGSLGPSAVKTIEFQVVVNTLPTINPLENQGKATYTFTVDPSFPDVETGANVSSLALTQVNQGSINFNDGGFTKVANRSYSTLGNTIVYTLTLRNTGNVTVNNVVVTDTIPNGTSFVPDSVFVDGGNQPGATPEPPGITVGSIGPNAQSIVIFRVLVTTLPTPNPISNNATVNYTFTVDPSVPDGGTGGGNSTAATTQVNIATFPNDGVGFVKSVEEDFAKIGDTLNYTVLLRNTGNTTATNVRFIDTIPNGTTFVPDSFLLNGVLQPGASPAPPSGVSLPNMAANSSVTLQFQVLVTSIGSPNPAPNQGRVQFTFTIDPTIPNGGSGNNTSNTPSTQINDGSINYANGGLIKSADPAFARIGDTITYTIAIRNPGNATVNNVVFTDTIPSGTNFVPDSVVIDGTTVPGLNPEPPTGISLASLPPNAASTIQFQVIIYTIPSPNPILNQCILTGTFTVDPAFPDEATTVGASNVVSTRMNQGIINFEDGGFTKYVNRNYALVGDTLTYTLAIRNTGTTAVNNLVITDTIPNGTTFVENSVSINGGTRIGANPSPPTGVTIGTLVPNVTVTMQFRVLITTLPIPNPIPNSATANFTYVLDPSTPDTLAVSTSSLKAYDYDASIQTTVGASGNTNIVYTLVDLLQLDAVKTSNRPSIKLGETLTYTILLTNRGTLTLSNPYFSDSLPNGLIFIPETVTIAGVSYPAYNPGLGFYLDTLPPNATVAIDFTSKLTSFPCPLELINQGVLRFSYQQAPTIPSEQGVVVTNPLSTEVLVNTFKQDNFSKYFTVPGCMDPIESILSLDTEVEICYLTLVTTPVAISYGGQYLTGRKLFIHGIIHGNYQYVGGCPNECCKTPCSPCKDKKHNCNPCVSDQPVLTFRTKLPFCTYIVIPTTSAVPCLDAIKTEVEDVSYILMNCRSIYESVTLRIDALV